MRDSLVSRLAKRFTSIALVVIAQATAMGVDFNSGYTFTGIGNPTVGSAQVVGNALQLTSQGSGLGGTADEYAFAYVPVTGNAEIVTKVSRPALESGGYLGVALRESLDAGARSVTAYHRNHSGGRVYAKLRQTVGGDASSLSGPTGVGDAIYLKLTREGSAARTFWSADGLSWALISEDIVAMATNAYLGIFVSSNSSDVLAEAVFESTVLTGQVVVIGGGSPNVTDESITFTSGTAMTGSSINLSGADLVIENKENAYIRIRNNSSEAFVVDPAGNFGLGASSPSLNLHIAGDASSDILLDRTQNLNVDSTARLGVGFLTGIGDEYVFLGGGTTLNNLAVQLDTGNVGVGTTTFANRLNVGGAIRAYELVVDSTWADYVFDDGYELLTLEEVQAHIEEKGYLPGVPSAESIQTEGLSIGESQALLMQKIEELTLYMIEKDKQFRELEKRNEAQQAEIERLKVSREQ